MAFQILPARRTGGQEFAEAFSPYLQQAFQMIMQKKIQDEQFKKNIELAKQMGLVTETQPGLQDYQQQIQGQGGAMNISPDLSPTEQFATAQKLFKGAGVKPPQPTYALTPKEGMKTSMKFEGGVPSFGVETIQPQAPIVGVYSASPDGTITKTGEVPKGSRVLTPLQMMTPEERSAQAALTKTTGEKMGSIVKMQRGEIFLNNIKDQWLKTNPPSVETSSTGLPTFGYSRGVGEKLGAQKGGMQQVKVYNDFVQGIRSQLARTIGQDVGNLSEYEQQAIISIVPIVSGMNADFKETGEDKINKLNQVIQDIYQARNLGYNDILEMYNSQGIQQPQQESVGQTSTGLKYTIER